MKELLIFSLLLIKSFAAIAQSKSAELFLPLRSDNKTAHYFNMSNGADYLDFFLNEKTAINGKTYHVRVRLYSWGVNDTTFMRADEVAFYSLNRSKKLESVLLPKQVVVGQKWMEADGTWDYEIMSINGDLKTPAKKYKGLIIVSAVQRKQKDPEKQPAYLLYYDENTGLVASSNDGVLGSYLAEIKTAE